MHQYQKQLKKMPSNEENSIEINNNLFSEDYDTVDGRYNSDFNGGEDEQDREGEKYGY